MRPIRSFVIRIYRQGKSRLDGVVEEVHSGRSVAFHDRDELWQALRPHRRPRVASTDDAATEAPTDSEPTRRP